MTSNVFHLAIPTRSLDLAEQFYIGGLGCRLARKYDDRITMDFFGSQVVCHLSPDEDYSKPPKMYPRHFGITFASREAFDDLYHRAVNANLTFFKTLFSRFEGKREEHLTFFLQDPSNNLLEFKFYYDSSMMY
ncbi:MAG: glyoxalase [Gammaproteobacteria bacterium CG11_big_fil_rev_8_21_14_0_20_46_22]|nr:MAG: glyoxalase [Gammaproteobacteria bacterium CG12_big_fil_rev_8_21_14_0_65_46_12]PIR12120.1 MAG: glyoxalase [Gammaproteobacteria bacterium CG11_big_fil_rev_8_21_14_0_20_46_22]